MSLKIRNWKAFQHRDLIDAVPGITLATRDDLEFAMRDWFAGANYLWVTLDSGYHFVHLPEPIQEVLRQSTSIPKEKGFLVLFDDGLDDIR